MFTDMEGSTAVTQRLGDARAQSMVRLHNEIVRDALHAFGGTEVKHTGDGIMSSFTSASMAVECAIAIQRALETHGEAHPDEAIRVRIGLNAGEPVAEGDDLFGTAVQLASRISARAEPRQVLVSDVVRQLVAGKGFLFADRGETELRGFEDPVRIFEVRWQEQQS
jgi:class 3 adenylate cyclase